MLGEDEGVEVCGDDNYWTWLVAGDWLMAVGGARESLDLAPARPGTRADRARCRPGEWSGLAWQDISQSPPPETET